MKADEDIRIGDILKELRTEKELTQDNLAEFLNIKRQTYSAWERNKSTPDINTINSLADYYSVSIDYILGRTDEKNPYEPETIAAHKEGDEWSEEELQSIEEFKEFVKARRKQKDKE